MSNNKSQLFSDYSGLVKRPAWKPGQGVEPQQVDWKSLLTIPELYCVVGNQLISHVQTHGNKWPEAHSLGAGHAKNEGYHYTSGKAAPGLECTEFYPLAKGDKHGGEMDVLPALLTFFNEIGDEIKVENDLGSRKWRPDLQEDLFRFEEGSFYQHIACAEDIVVCRITPHEGQLPFSFEINCDFGGTRGTLEIEQNGGRVFVWGQENDWSQTVFGFWCNAQLEILEISLPGQAIRYRLAGKSRDEIILAYTVGYHIGDLKAHLKRYMTKPEEIFSKSTAFWDEYFTTQVPYFNCSNLSYVRQYYYTFFCLRANVWEIPYEPLKYPYTCTSKLIWKWSWPWNSIFDNVTLRWLNDRSLAEGNVLLQFYLGRSMMEDHILLGFPDLVPREDSNTFPIAYGNISTNTTIYDAIWMTYLVTGNREWIEKLYPAIKEHYFDMLGRCNSKGLAGWGLDEWDMTARVKAFAPDTMIDASCFLASCSDSLAGMARVLGLEQDECEFTRKAYELRIKIQEKLWDKDRKIFIDANVQHGTFSPIKTAASFDPLYCGAATTEQAEFLIKHLTNPEEFWTPYPIPAFSIDTPEFQADGENIGNGPIPPISCGWFQISGLVRYGYRELAAELIRRQMKMNTLHGVSSAVKFNPVTGEGLQFFVSRKEDHSLCTMNATIVDLVIQYVVGFRPREDGLLEFDPIELQEGELDYILWGPYKYRGLQVSMKWERKGDFVIKVGDSVYTAGCSQRVVLKYEKGKLVRIE